MPRLIYFIVLFYDKNIFLSNTLRHFEDIDFPIIRHRKAM